jgi:hypothetical protein
MNETERIKAIASCYLESSCDMPASHFEQNRLTGSGISSAERVVNTLLAYFTILSSGIRLHQIRHSQVKPRGLASLSSTIHIFLYCVNGECGNWVRGDAAILEERNNDGNTKVM